MSVPPTADLVAATLRRLGQAQPKPAAAPKPARPRGYDEPGAAPETHPTADLLREARRALARAGGIARSAAMTSEERAKSASHAAKKRWAAERSKRKKTKRLQM